MSSLRNEGIREQLTQKLTALLTERVRIVGNVITLVVEDRQSKIEMEQPRIDQLKADHLATSEPGKLVMRLWSLSGTRNRQGFSSTAQRNRLRPH